MSLIAFQASRFTAKSNNQHFISEQQWHWWCWGREAICNFEKQNRCEDSIFQRSHCECTRVKVSYPGSAGSSENKKNKKSLAISWKSTLKINVKSHATVQTWSSTRVERHGGSKSHSAFAGVWLLQWKSLLHHWGASVIFIHFIKKRIKTHEQRKTNSSWSLWDHRLLLLLTEMLQMGSLDNIIRFSFVCAEYYCTITLYIL